MEPRICELCDAEAVVFCPSDAAYLCWTCDAQVHQANFLVARHFRHPLIRTQPGDHDDGLDSLSSSNSSSKECSFACRKKSCSSSSVGELKIQHANPRPPVCYFKTEGIFLNWIRKLGVGGEEDVGIACRAFNVCLDRWKGWPLRLCLAASLCLGLRAKSVITWQVLKRLEQLSGVPANLILAAESKLELRGGRRRRRVELEEGWAEC
ncbi:B-box zinc finger protein 32 [Primulina tabacum]|uniref:B-box zinc finger protein 32 n=1 Tax=Primulina tabacum TaxID=48773 RepID=UPI003F5A4686